MSGATAARLRLFFALWPDAASRAVLSQWALGAQAACGGRPMRAPNLHFTLAFLGDTDPARLDALLDAAATVPARRFSIDVDRVEYWRHNRIVWAGASTIPEGLAALVRDLRAALDHAGIRYDAKPFLAHVTLLRDAHPATLPPFDAMSWPVESFALVRSVAGADYTNLREWRVKAA